MVKIGIVGVGAVGAPIAHRLYRHDPNSLFVISDTEHEETVKAIRSINGETFNPTIITSACQIEGHLDILILSVKNYSLISTLEFAEQFITPDTIIVPLQNGIWACRYLRNKYRFNVIAECYVRGPDTKRVSSGFSYSKSGKIHIGTSIGNEKDKVKIAFKYLKECGLDIYYEENIRLMVWRKWMLNVAGNTVTALTGANYSMFAESKDLQIICRKIMREFIKVSDAANVGLTNVDIDETIDYFVGFQSGKITSMLEDVLNFRKTENEYIAGELLRMGEEYDIKLPITTTVYTLMKLKEEIYLKEKQQIIT